MGFALTPHVRAVAGLARHGEMPDASSGPAATAQETGATWTCPPSARWLDRQCALMDVLSLDYSRATPYDEDPRSSPGERLRDLIRWLFGVRGGGGSPDGSTAAGASPNAIHGFTAAEILLGAGLLAFVTAAVPIGDGIASRSLAGTALAGTTGGVLLWTMFGLLASVRSTSAPGGSVHFSFDLPFVGAAMILGGPTAGAWVAVLSTLDRRELQSQPWYGTLANHSAVAIAAVLGGLAYAMVLGGLSAATGDPGLSTFVAIIVAGLVLEGVASGLALVTVKLRDRRPWTYVLGVAMGNFRHEMLLEVALIWVLVVASSTVGWWAPLAVGIAVITYLSIKPEPSEPVDPLTRLMRKSTFVAAAERMVDSIQRRALTGTMVFLDLRDFRLINDQLGRDVGDSVLVAVADRLRVAFPGQGDLLSRFGDDRFCAFLGGHVDQNAAKHMVSRLIDAIGRPISTQAGPVNVAAAVGIVVVLADDPTTHSISTLISRAEQAMFHAKNEGGGSSGWHIWSPSDRPPLGG